MNPDDLAKLLAHFGVPAAAPADATRVASTWLQSHAPAPQPEPITPDIARRVLNTRATMQGHRSIGPRTSGNIPITPKNDAIEAMGSLGDAMMGGARAHPVINALASIPEVGSDVLAGKYGGAALGTGMAALPFVPGGKILRALGGAGDAALHEVEPEAFHAAVNAFAEARPSESGFLTHRTPDAMRAENMRTFLAPDGKTGYALAPLGDGRVDIRNVFNHGEKGAGAVALAHALSQGGNVLDHFDTKLGDFYRQFGFKEYVPPGENAARLPWNQDYAPEGWDAAKHGTPDVVNQMHPEAGQHDPSYYLGQYLEAKPTPNTAPAPPRVQWAAYRDSKTGRVFTGEIHAGAAGKISRDLYAGNDNAMYRELGDRFEDGFVLNDGTFLNRRETHRRFGAGDANLLGTDADPETDEENLTPWTPGQVQSVARSDPALARTAAFDRVQGPADKILAGLRDGSAVGDSVATAPLAAIRAAAIRLPDGSVHAGPNGSAHWSAIEAAMSSGKLPPAEHPDFERLLQQSHDGFVDTNGQFLTRAQATTRLRKMGHDIPSGFPASSLTSEEVHGFQGAVGDSVAVRGVGALSGLQHSLKAAQDILQEPEDSWLSAHLPARPAAPAVVTPPANGDVFDTSKLGSALPAGFTDERPPIKYPTARTDVSMYDDIDQRFRRVYTPNALKALAADPRNGGWYDTSQLRQAFLDHSPTGADDFDQFMKFMGPTSSGTTVPGNIRQASKFYELWKSGQLSLDDLKNGTLSLPPGYANRRQSSINGGIRRILEQGNLDPIAQPKTYRYSNQLAGRAWGGAALDMHVGRQVGKQGLLDAGDGPLVKATGFPQASYNADRAVATSPQNNHYAVIEDGLVKEAKRLGLPPAVYQAAGWVGGAQKTGVADPRAFMDLMNQILKNSATKYNHASALDALRAFIKGQSPLWGVAGMLGAGAAAGGSDPNSR